LNIYNSIDEAENYPCEYVIIDPIDPNNQILIKMFETRHFGHPLATIPLSDVKYCKNIEKEIFNSLYLDYERKKINN